MTLKVSDIGEKELIKYILANCKTITPDDTAVTPIANTNLISTCDMLIQSKHFPENMSYFQMGFKSDIEIAQEAVVQDIREIAKKLNLTEEDLDLYENSNIGFEKTLNEWLIKIKNKTEV